MSYKLSQGLHALNVSGVEGGLEYGGSRFKNDSFFKKLSVPFGPKYKKVITPIWSEVQKSYRVNRTKNWTLDSDWEGFRGC